MAVCQYDRYEWDGVTDVIIWISISCWHCDRYASKFQCKTQPNRTTKKFFIKYTHWTRLKKKKPWSNCTTFLLIQVTTRKTFRWPSLYACSNFFLGDQLNKIFRLVEFDSLIESKCKKKKLYRLRMYFCLTVVARGHAIVKIKFNVKVKVERKKATNSKQLAKKKSIGLHD